MVEGQGVKHLVHQLRNIGRDGGRAGCETFGSPVEEYWQRWGKGRV